MAIFSLPRCVISTALLCCTSFLSAQVTKEEALTKLLEGNKRYITNSSIHPNQAEIREKNLIAGQSPFAIIVSCSDSRVAPEIIFDQGIGDVFVVRVAGAVIGPIELDTIVFAATQLKSPLIVVLGHEKCSAIISLANSPTLPELSAISPYVLPAIEKAKLMKEGLFITNAIHENTRSAMAAIRANKQIAALEARKELQVVGGYYQLSTGEVLLLP